MLGDAEVEDVEPGAGVSTISADGNGVDEVGCAWGCTVAHPEKATPTKRAREIVLILIK